MKKAVSKTNITTITRDRNCETRIDSRHRSPGIHLIAIMACLYLVAAAPARLRADTIPVPNGSFESQVAGPPFGVDNRVDSWQKTDQPIWFDPTAAGITWDQTSGVFANTPSGQPNHIDNMTGNQGLYMFALPQVGLFQDYNSTDWNNATHTFDATYEVGKSYRLEIGVIGGGGGMPEGAGLLVGMYYRDAANNLITVGASQLAFNLSGFPSTTHFIDYAAEVATVQAGDAWAGQKIGIEIMATSGTGAGYWDLDNVRLDVVPEPGSLSLLALGGGGLLLGRRFLRRRA